ncbi:DUF4389 domain-containing protein [Methylomonas rapida]|jgi:hypothetical protein|uniref:DUF4389 domain-containing protein n=1 Tax=Methylomonas rapida TaxID=2963939 RepID=A0ABY7GKX7_9GAMM|nr:DUF4389 domain-containing protein [Methylomonas rapida]WAR45149.1 DUF4389 domain-containing protein [Methylomonas rapida]
MQDSINENLKKLDTWKRIIFMLIYAAIDSMVKLLLWLVVLLQVGSVLLTGSVNPNILGFGRSLSTYHYHILLFLTFNTERLPFPFSDWNLTSEPESLDKL